MDTSKEGIGNRLREFCDQNFKTQVEFGQAVGIAPTNLRTFYFSGKNMPGVPLLIKLLDYDCNIIWLLTGEGSPKLSLKAFLDASAQYTSSDEENKQLQNRIRDLEGTINLIIKTGELALEAGKSNDEGLDPGMEGQLQPH